MCAQKKQRTIWTWLIALPMHKVFFFFEHYLYSLFDWICLRFVHLIAERNTLQTISYPPIRSHLIQPYYWVLFKVNSTQITIEILFIFLSRFAFAVNILQIFSSVSSSLSNFIGNRVQRKGVKCIFESVCMYEYVCALFEINSSAFFYTRTFICLLCYFRLIFFFRRFLSFPNFFSFSIYFFFIKTHKATHGKTHNIMNKKCAAFFTVRWKSSFSIALILGKGFISGFFSL